MMIPVGYPKYPTVRNGHLDEIELNLKSNIICQNENRLGILFLLKESPRNEMQAERIAHLLGISHRTVLYHLEILHEYELVEVREFKKKGEKMMRSVWGLSTKNKTKVRKVFTKICTKVDTKVLDGLKESLAKENKSD